MTRPPRKEWTWAVGVDISTRACGLVVGTRRGLESRPMRLTGLTLNSSKSDTGDRIWSLVDRAQNWLLHAVKGADANVLAVLEEPVYYPGHRADTQTAVARAVGALEYVLGCWGWRVELVKPGAGKAAMAGSVRAGKDAVIWSARMMTDHEITDEHQADALAALMACVFRQGVAH
jgi:Holliday junction resolvasome RuvABC endonuclease subunit